VSRGGPFTFNLVQRRAKISCESDLRGSRPIGLETDSPCWLALRLARARRWAMSAGPAGDAKHDDTADTDGTVADSRAPQDDDVDHPASAGSARNTEFTGSVSATTRSRTRLRPAESTAACRYRIGTPPLVRPDHCAWNRGPTRLLFLCGSAISPTNGFGDTQSIAIGIDQQTAFVGPQRPGTAQTNDGRR
jgi:hypothetical protein